MIFKQLWERYFLKNFAKVFFFFLFCFYGLYVLVDFASHTSALAHHHVQIKGLDLIRYYSYIFASRAEILIPLALLIAFCKTVTTLNMQGELVAMLVGGYKLKRLMRPFLFAGLFGVMLLYLNEQFLLPTALTKLRGIESKTKHQRSKNKSKTSVNPMLLNDGSLFLFLSYDEEMKQFFDAYWIQSIDDVYRIKYLDTTTANPTGKFVDHLKRNGNGELELVESFPTHLFHDLQINNEALRSAIVDSDALPLTQLWTELPAHGGDLSEKQSKMATAFYWKLVMPWLCLIAILAPAPFCVYFSRQFPTFFVYIAGIFGMLAFYLFMDAAQIVAKKQVMPPEWAMGIPFLLLFMCVLSRYAYSVKQ